MIIVVNTRLLPGEFFSEKGIFLYETFSRMSKKYPEHKFIFITDKSFYHDLNSGANCKIVITGPAAKFSLLWRLWYNLKVPALLKKYKADIFVSGDGICSLAADLPQCVVMHDLAFLQVRDGLKKSQQSFLKIFTPRFIQKAKRIVTLTEFSKKKIIQEYQTDPAKIDVVFSAVNEIFHPVDANEKENVIKKYTDGKEYFVFAGDVTMEKTLISLLKAFSVFKKRQQTGIKLVLTGRYASANDSFNKRLASYKYRNDVVMTGAVDEKELVKIIGSGYGFVYPVLVEGFGIPVLQAMKCGVPVITSSNTPMQELAGDAALYIDPMDYNDIAGKMMLLYKDESLRKEMIAKGLNAAGNYTWDKTTDLFWESINKTVNKE